MDFRHVVVKASDFQPFTLGIDHAPTRQVVQRRAPQHGFFTARVHRHVATDARCVRAGRIDGKNQARFFARLFHAPRDRARPRVDRHHVMIHHRTAPRRDGVNLNELFGVDDD